MNEQEQMKVTPEEEQAMINYLAGKGLMDFPQQEEKGNLFSFFINILKAQDTLKVGNLAEDEIARVRRLRTISNYCDLEGLNFVRDHIHKEAEIILGSSLSRAGFFVERSITSKREVSSEAKSGDKKKKGLFRSK